MADGWSLAIISPVLSIYGGKKIQHFFPIINNFRAHIRSPNPSSLAAKLHGSGAHLCFPFPI
jgi:hypothetical protein